MNEHLSCRVIINQVCCVTRVHLQNHLNNQALILIIGDLMIYWICLLWYKDNCHRIHRLLLNPTVYHTYVISVLRNHGHVTDGVIIWARV